MVLEQSWARILMVVGVHEQGGCGVASSEEGDRTM